MARAYESASSLNFILSRSFIVLIYFYFNNFDSNKGMDSHKETVKQVLELEAYLLICTRESNVVEHMCTSRDLERHLVENLIKAYL